MLSSIDVNLEKNNWKVPTTNAFSHESNIGTRMLAIILNWFFLLLAINPYILCNPICHTAISHGIWKHCLFKIIQTLIKSHFDEAVKLLLQYDAISVALWGTPFSLRESSWLQINTAVAHQQKAECSTLMQCRSQSLAPNPTGLAQFQNCIA